MRVNGYTIEPGVNLRRVNLKGADLEGVDLCMHLGNLDTGSGIISMEKLDGARADSNTIWPDGRLSEWWPAQRLRPKGLFCAH